MLAYKRNTRHHGGDVGDIRTRGDDVNVHGLGNRVKCLEASLDIHVAQSRLHIIITGGCDRKTSVGSVGLDAQGPHLVKMRIVVYIRLVFHGGQGRERELREGPFSPSSRQKPVPEHRLCL